jgi:hypothetical protein
MIQSDGKKKTVLLQIWCSPQQIPGDCRPENPAPQETNKSIDTSSTADVSDPSW